MGLLDKVSKLAKSEQAQKLVHAVEEKAKDPKVQARVEGLKDKAGVVATTVKDKAEAELAKHRGGDASGSTSSTASNNRGGTSSEAKETAQGVEVGAGRSVDADGKPIDPVAGPEDKLPG
jgi:hypothetical protein